MAPQAPVDDARLVCPHRVVVVAAVVAGLLVEREVAIPWRSNWQTDRVELAGRVDCFAFGRSWPCPGSGEYYLHSIRPSDPAQTMLKLQSVPEQVLLLKFRMSKKILTSKIMKDQYTASICGRCMPQTFISKTDQDTCKRVKSVEARAGWCCCCGRCRRLCRLRGLPLSEGIGGLSGGLGRGGRSGTSQQVSDNGRGRLLGRWLRRLLLSEFQSSLG